MITSIFVQRPTSLGFSPGKHRKPKEQSLTERLKSSKYFGFMRPRINSSLSFAFQATRSFSLFNRYCRNGHEEDDLFCVMAD
jgi:hypothetical protein